MRRSVVLAAGVGTVLGVDLDAVALIDEQRDLNLGSGLNGGRLGAGVGAVALQARLGVGDGQDHGARQIDAQRGAVVEGDQAVGAFEQELGLVAQKGLRNHDLIVGGHVHEHEVVTVLVGVLESAVVHGLEFHLHARVEGLVNR